MANLLSLTVVATAGCVSGIRKIILRRLNIRRKTMSKPDCYECKFRRNFPGDAHSSCANVHATVAGDPHGIENGWFFWPFNFDPVWLISCDSFTQK